MHRLWWLELQTYIAGLSNSLKIEMRVMSKKL